MSNHFDDDDTYDPSQADSDIRKLIEQKNVAPEPEKPSKDVYCRGKIANGKHDFGLIRREYKSGYADGGKIFGLARRKVFYEECEYRCAKCGTRYIHRAPDEETKRIPAHKDGMAGVSWIVPAKNIGTGRSQPLPAGLESWEWFYK